MKKIYLAFLLLFSLLLNAKQLRAQLTVTTGQTALQLAQALTGSGVTVLNPTLVCPSAVSSGIFSGTSNLGIDSGIVLTTGRAATTSNSIGVNGTHTFFADNPMGGAGDAEITAATGQPTFDACKLEFDVIPSGDTLRFNYVMGTEEYPEFRCDIYTDGFGFYISGPGYTVPTNIAKLPNTNVPVTVKNLFCNVSNPNFNTNNFTVNNGNTIVYNAFTKRFVALAAVTPCSTYHLKLVIADAADNFYDSGVFLEKGSLSSPSTVVSVAGGSVDGVNSLTTPKPYAVRGCLDGKFKFSRAYATSSPLTINYQITGTAVNGIDYASIPTSVTIPANAVSVDRIINPTTTASGMKTVKLRIYSTNACNSSTIVDSVSLDIRDSLHSVVTTASAVLCSGQSTAVNVEGDNMLTYSWSPAAGVNPANSKTPTITPAATTTYQVTASLPGSTCPAVKDTIRLTVPVNSVMIASNSPVCSGTALNLTAGTVAGTTYSWTGPNGFTSSLQNPSIAAMTAAAAGTYSMTATTDGCTFAPVTTTVTMSTVPAQPAAITGSALACTGTSTNTYSINPVPTATSYAWTASGTGWAGSSTGLTFSPTAGVAAGTLSVTASNVCGTSVAQTMTVNTQTTPVQPGAITGSALGCTGTSTNTYSISAVGSATSYAWTASGTGWSGSGNGLTFNPTAGTGTGTVSVTAANVCGTSVPQTLTVNTQTTPVQPGTISGSTLVCSSSSTNSYGISAVPTATSYAWTVSGTGWSGSGSGLTFSPTAGSGTGTISVTATNVCGTSTAKTLTVNTQTTPVQPGTITGSTLACIGTSTGSYSISAVGSATSYAWTASGTGWSGTSSTTSYSPTVGSGTGTISVTASNACGTSAPQTLAVNTQTTPVQPGTISGSTLVCTGTSSNSYSIAAVGSATGYTWTTSGTGWSGTSSTTSYSPTAGSATGTISVTANNACGTSVPQTLAVNTQTTPVQPGTISGSILVCSSSSTNSYGIGAVPTATSYAWTVSGTGWSGTSNTTSYTPTAGSATGTISVTATNICGTSVPQTLAVNTQTTPVQPGTISGGTLACIGTSTSSYSISAVPTATSYAWTASGTGWSGTSTTTSYSPTAGSGTGTISVTASNACGTSAPQTLAVNTQTTPVQPGTISGSTLVCTGTSSNSYSIAAVGSATGYTWTTSGTGWSGTSSTTSYSPTAGSATGTISVTATNVCGTSTPQTLTVNTQTTPAQPGTISGTTSVCATSAQSYSIGAVSTATSYTWTATGTGWSGTGSGTSFSSTAGTANGILSVTATNSCGTSTPRTQTITVTPLSTPAVGIVPNSGTTICAGSSASFTATPTNGGATPVYQWKKNGNNVGTNSSSYTDNSLTSGENISVVLTSNVVCPSTTTATSPSITMTVNPLLVPGVSVATTSPSVICAGTSVTYSTTTTNGGAAPSYQWRLNGINIGGNTPTYTTGSLANGDVVTVVMTTSTACYTTPTANSIGSAMTVKPILATSVSLVTSATTPTCLGTNIAFLAVAGNGGVTPSYQWFKNGLSISNSTASMSSAAWANGDVYSVKMTSSEQCVTAATVTSNNVTMIGQVPVTPAVTITSTSPTAVCAGTPVSFNATGTNGGPTASYLWKRNGNVVGAGPTYSSSLLANNDLISVEMTGSIACATSPTATSNAMSVTVTPAVIPGINVNVTPPSTLCAGTMRTFFTNIVGGGSQPQYQWQLNGVDVGTNSPVYNTNTLANGDSVRCILTSNATCATPAIQQSNKVGIIVHAFANPAVTITASPSLQLTAGQPVTFTATMVDGGTAPVMQWYKNNAGIPNATGTTYTSSTLKGGDVISVRMLSSADCAPGTPVVSNPLALIGSTGIATSPSLGGIKLYPNPNTGRFTLEGVAVQGQHQYINVVNSIGQTVFHTELVPQRTDWQLELNLTDNLSSGIYILRLENESGRIQKPFVIQR